MTTNAACWDAGSTQPRTLLSRLALFAEPLARAHARRRTESALADLDDHMLRDIGINPSMLPRRRSVAEWVLQSHSGTARLVFVGR